MGAEEQGISRTLEEQALSAWCVRCGARINRHEPLVIVDRGGAHRSTLAFWPHRPLRGETIYHPACYEATGGQPIATGPARVFAEAVCGVDGGDGSYAGVEQAASLVGAGGHLTVLAVTSLRTGAHQAYDPTDVVERASMLAYQARVSCRVEVDPAEPAPEVVSKWASGHDLLAIGAPPKSVLAGMLFSGVTDTAIRSLSTPLLVARPAAASGRFAERMLVASDGLRGSDELVAFAGAVASDVGSELTLVHALGRRSVTRQARIDAQVQGLQTQGADGDGAVIESGSADDVIIAAAARLEASLVVMSSRRRSGLSMLGSVSRRVVHHAGCSVLLVPPERLLAQRGRGHSA
jgi:nucleotide-binding universal stress UspA family protein